MGEGKVQGFTRSFILIDEPVAPDTGRKGFNILITHKSFRVHKSPIECPKLSLGASIYNECTFENGH